MPSQSTTPPVGAANARSTEAESASPRRPAPPRPSRWQLLALIPGYLLYTLFQIFFAPVITFRATRRGRRNRYHGVGWRRLWGGLGPPRPAPWTLLVASGAGERRTAIAVAQELYQTRTRDVAVLVQECAPVEDTRFPIGPAPFNSPMSALFALLAWRPRAILFVEFANNYHLAWWARVFGIPIGLVNVNLSEHRTRRLRRKPLGRWQFHVIPRYAVHARVHARRLAALGVPAHAITVTGVGMGPFRGDAEAADDLRNTWHQALGIETGTPVVVAGSTYPDEEAVLVRVFQRLRDRYPEARLVVAPRHLDRREPLDAALPPDQTAVRSRGADLDTPPIWLLDTRGELKDVYAIATVAFVGGSWVPGIGGHTPLEAMVWGVPTAVGPHTGQQEAVVETAREAGAVRVVRTEAELLEHWMRAITDQEFRLETALRARRLVQASQGAYTRSYDAVLGVLPAPDHHHGRHENPS